MISASTLMLGLLILLAIKVGDERIVVIQEGRDQPIAKINSKTCLLKKCSLTKKLKPGDIVRGKIVADRSNYYVFQPLEILKRLPNECNILVVKKVLKIANGSYILEFDSPALQPHAGKEVEVVIILPKLFETAKNITEEKSEEAIAL